MGELNRYIFRRAAVTVSGLVAFALVVLLLERLLRIFQVVATSSQPASDATQMVVNLLPHYLGIAIPMALLLGIIITVDRLSKSSELVAGLGAGVSLSHMTRPFLLIAAILAVLTLFIEGIAQPVGRYNYRKVEYGIGQQSFAAVLREGTFTEVGNRTFFAGTDLSGADIGPIFIYERLLDDGITPPESEATDPSVTDPSVTEGKSLEGIRITTAQQGRLEIRESTREPMLQLSAGQTYQLRDARRLLGGLSFSKSAITGNLAETRFRERGSDERELTTLELIRNLDGSLSPDVDPATNAAALHLRIARTLLLLVLPFIAVPFGINYGRNPSSAGIFIGVVMLLAINKSLEFAQNLGESGAIPPALGIWAIIGVVTAFAAWIFRASAVKMGQPPLTSFQYWIKDMQDGLRGLVVPRRSEALETARA